MKIHNIRQRSVEWHAMHRGIPTASEFDRIITPAGARSGQARKYMYQLAYERITEKVITKDLSGIPHVKHGIDNEPKALDAFETHTKLKVEPIGFISNDAGTVGCSPDGIIAGRLEGVEIKCPTGPVQCGYLIDGIEREYRAQIQGQILICGFKCVHFYSWSDELPHYYRCVVPDRDFLRSLAAYLEEFEMELIRGVAHIRKMGGWPRNAPSVFPDDEPDDAA